MGDSKREFSIKTTKEVRITKKLFRGKEEPVNLFKPTIRLEYFFSIILVLVLILALLTFPLSALLNAGVDEASAVVFKVGWPMPFFELTYNDIQKNPINFLGLLVDLLLYFLVAYILDVTIGLVYAKLVNSSKGQIEQSKKEVGYLSKIGSANDKQENKKKSEINPQHEVKQAVNPVQQTNFYKKQEVKEDPYQKAREFYEHHKTKGADEKKVREMLKKAGWSERDLNIVFTDVR